MLFEIVRVLGNAVGCIALEPVPHELVGIKFRRIPWKEVHMDFPMFLDKGSDRSRLMGRTLVPDKDESSLKVFGQVPEKSKNFGSLDIPQGMKTRIKFDTPALGRYADGRNCRDLSPTAGDFENRSLSSWRPSLSDGRDKTKPALVKEDKGKLSPLGLFLYAATDGVSNVLFPLHPSAVLFSQVFDNSSPFRSGATRYYWGDRRPETSSLSPWQFSGSSKDRSDIRSSLLLQRGFGQDSSSGARLVSRVSPAQVSTSILCPRLSYILLSSYGLRFWNNLSSEKQPTDSFLGSGAQRLAGAAVQVLFGFHGVS